MESIPGGTQLNALKSLSKDFFCTLYSATGCGENESNAPEKPLIPSGHGITKALANELGVKADPEFVRGD